MKLVIMSDSHLNNDLIQNIINHHQDATYYIHCGDAQALIKHERLLIVKGNNDFQDYPQTITLNIEGKNVLITHGHLFNVDTSLALLTSYAKEHHIDLVCFGHTHQPCFETIDHITFINPGSVRFPEGRIYIPTYCIYENNQCDFYNAKTFEKIDDIFTPKKKISLFQKLFKNKS